MKKVILAVFVLAMTIALAAAAQAAPKLSKKKTTLYIGESLQLTVKNATKKVKWTSSAKKTVSVTQKGVIKAKKAGKAVITAKVGTKKLTCKVTVKNVLKINKKTVKAVPEGSAVVTFFKDGYSVNYDIADPDIVECTWGDEWYDNNNKTNLYFTGKKNGATTVTISNTYNSEKIKIKVKVSNAPKANEVAFDKFAAYIDDNGLSTSDGFLMGYRITPSSGLYAKFYHRYGNDMVRMILDDSTSNQYLEMQLVRGAEKAYVYYEVDYGYIGARKNIKETEGYVLVASYRDSSTPGVFYDSDSTANSYLPLAFGVWRAMLRERGFDVTLYDLGFISLK